MQVLAKLAMQSLSDHETPFDFRNWKSNGFSDSTILQLTLPRGRFAIRSWPNRLESKEKIDFWAKLNQRFAHSNVRLNEWGPSVSTPFPRLHEWTMGNIEKPNAILFEGRLWSLSQWVDGQPLLSSSVDTQLVSHLATVLGRIHAMSARESGDNASLSTMRSSSLLERLSAMQSVDYDLFRMIDKTEFFAEQELDSKAKHCVASLIERKPHWERFLVLCSGQERVCHWIVRDLWRENILLDKDQHFSSIVDLGAARIDWPGLDFIRLFGSLDYEQRESSFAIATPTVDLWQDAYKAYTHAHPSHSNHSLEECRLLHHVSSGLALVQWLKWIANRTMDLTESVKIQRVSSRMHELCDRFLDYVG